MVGIKPVGQDIALPWFVYKPFMICAKGYDQIRQFVPAQSDIVILYLLKIKISIKTDSII